MSDDVRALLGALGMVSCVLLYWMCAFKLALCLDNRAKGNMNRIPNSEIPI